MTVAIQSPARHVVSTKTDAASRVERKESSTTKMFVTTVLSAIAFVWILSGVLFGLWQGDVSDGIVFGGFLAFWLGIGGGLIAGGAVLSQRDERNAHSKISPSTDD